MKEELKQAIDSAETKFYNEVKFKPQQSIQDSFLSGVYAALQDTSILRHADPKVMDDAGWFNKSKLIPETAGLFFPVHCECGWIGSSEELLGGGQIADTGDYGDSYCPACGIVEPSEVDELTIEDYKNAIKSMTKIIVGLRYDVEKNYLEKQAGWVREEEWISVKDRLPKRGENVLLKRAKPFHIYLVTGFQRDGVFYSNESAKNFDKVTHWKPLPQPPKQ